MLEKFLISIGLKQPDNIPNTYIENTTTVRPSGENKFVDDENFVVNQHMWTKKIKTKTWRQMNG